VILIGVNRVYSPVEVGWGANCCTRGYIPPRTICLWQGSYSMSGSKISWQCGMFGVPSFLFALESHEKPRPCVFAFSPNEAPPHVQPQNNICNDDRDCQATAPSRVSGQSVWNLAFHPRVCTSPAQMARYTQSGRKPTLCLDAPRPLPILALLVPVCTQLWR